MREQNNRPNIILINCDDMGYGDLGCYGSTVHRTPAIDRLADEGMRFTDFYMASPVCSPSRGAMLTGCYPPRIGFGRFEGRWVLFPGQGVGLSENEVTIADILKSQGYSTMHIGKWHCGDQPEFLPTNHGFDEYYGIPYSNDMGRHGPDDRMPPLPLMRDKSVVQAQPDQRNLIERYTEQSVRFIRDNRDEPFFLYLAHMQVHLPLYAPQRFVDGSKNGRYGACVEAVDWSTDVLMRELAALGLEENTIVIFTSDNGGRAKEGGSNAPLNGIKGTCWEGGLRVPCIIRWNGRIQAGAISDQVVASLDFLPTLANLAGAADRIPTDRVIDGVDQSDLLTGRSKSGTRKVFFYYSGNTLCAVRRGRWKLWVYRGREVAAVRELYDLADDIGETKNVVDYHPQIVAELTALIEDCRADMGDEATGVIGENIRPLGAVDNPVTLTQYDPDYPYIIAEYDLKERG